MQAYKGALGELREDMQASPFTAWTLEQLKVRSFYPLQASQASQAVAQCAPHAYLTGTAL